MLKYTVELMIINEDFFDKIEIDDSVISMTIYSRKSVNGI